MRGLEERQLMESKEDEIGRKILEDSIVPKEGCKYSVSYRQLTASPTTWSRFRRYSEETAKVFAFRLPSLHLLRGIVAELDVAVILVYLLAVPSLEEGERRHLAKDRRNDEKEISSRSSGWM